MLRHRILLLLAFSGLMLAELCAQYYAPFHATSKKAYIASNGMGRVYSLAFDSSIAFGPDTQYYHFGRLNDTSTFILPACIGWGPPYCLPTDLPEWSGSLFRSDGNGNYLFRNLASDSLHFDLTLGLNDTSTFFQQGNERFAITFESLDTLTVIGVLDSVRTYRILHTDTISTPILSTLHQQPLSIGKVLGLTHFFQIDSFPQVLKPLVMIGNKAPDAGLHQITNEMIYDHHAGDVIQTHHSASYPGSPPPSFFNSYTKVNILFRTDTPDSIWYDVFREHVNLITGILTSSYTIQKYFRHDLLTEIPFERFQNAYYHQLALIDYCGLPLWSYFNTKALYLEYCPDGNCWSSYDTGGPDPSHDDRWVLGLGRYWDHGSNFGLPPVGFSSSTYINYFNKGGVGCGTEQFLGIAEQSMTTPSLTVSPNPGSGAFILLTDGAIQQVDVFAAAGSAALRNAPLENNSLDLGALAPGMYVLKVRFINGAVAHRTVLRIN